MHVRRSFSLPVLSFLAAVLVIVGCGTGNQQEATSPPIQSVVKFSSQPPTAANEGDAYKYTLAASDVAGGVITFALPTAPEGTVLNGNQLTWTPNNKQSRLPNQFSVEATSSAGGHASQHWTITPTGTIRGTQVVNWWTEGGTQIPISSDLTGLPINAIIPGSSGFTTLPGVGKSDGTFTIPKIRAGYFWLQFGKAFLWTNSNQLDMGHDEIGRPDVKTAAYGGFVNFNLTNMQTYDYTHAFQWYSQNARTLQYLYSCYPSQPNTLDCSYPLGLGENLIDASKGDSCLVTQLVPTTYVDGQVYSPHRYFHSVITEVDGGSATLSGSFLDTVPTGSFRANVKGSAFHAMVPSINPNASEFLTFAGILAMSYGTGLGYVGDAPYQLGYWGEPPVIDDADLGDIPLLSPNPSWLPLLDYEHWMRVDYSVPGISTTQEVETLIYNYTLSLPTVDSPIQPAMGPVGSPLINGADFFQDQTVAGLTPTLTWTAPSVGSPNVYVVRVYQFSSNSDPLPVARFHTTQTRIQIPDGVLQTNRYYYFAIESRLQANRNPEAGPYRYSLPQAGAQALSGVLSFAATTSSEAQVRRLAVTSRVKKYIEPTAETRLFQHREKPMPK